MRAVITVAGKDRVGITASVCSLLAQHNINILDITQTVLQEFFTMVMLVDAGQSSVPFGALADTMSSLGQDLGLSIHAQREDTFEAMHRI